jgi:hypothetical protein
MCWSAEEGLHIISIQYIHLQSWAVSGNKESTGLTQTRNPFEEEPLYRYRSKLRSNHRQLVRYEKNGLESAFGTKKKHILKNN